MACKEGHYIVKDSPPKCEKCTFEKDKCIACSNATTCTACEVGYTIRPVVSKVTNITHLNKTDAATKKKSQEEITTMDCVECPTADGCATCKNSLCDLCLAGHYLNDKGTCPLCHDA